MIEKVEISGSNNYKITDNFQKYVEKRIGKLDRYLPRTHKKDIIARIVVTEVDRAHGNKYEISVAMEIPGGKVIAARDECSNVFAGIDILEAKMMNQIRRFKTEISPKHSKNPFSRLVRRK
ncbi:MAG: ribosome-associated translation inhibitor RaiA [Candidatus Saccharibacteria bacterium]|nr:ribosome-associated translation inhibitor RaiA [Candidatus Saccharibacteria bacterium]